MLSMERCRKAEIYDPEHNLICEAAVSVGPLDDLILDVPASFPHDAFPAFCIIFYHPVSGLVQTRCALSGFVTQPGHRATVRCSVQETLGEEQRRNDLKVPVTLELEASVLRTPSGSKPKEPTFPIQTRNISAGGVYFVCPYDLEPGALVLFQLGATKPPLRLTARVLRSEPLKPRKGTPQFGLGCQFVGMDSATESNLRGFVFRQERQARGR